jgi:hypothetical protein
MFPEFRTHAANGLHPNPKCYALWTSILRPILLARFGPSQAGDSVPHSVKASRL